MPSLSPRSPRGVRLVNRALAMTPLSWLNHMTSALDVVRTDQSGLIEELNENFVGRVSVLDQLTQRLSDLLLPRPRHH